MGIGDFQRALADMTLDASLARSVRSGGAGALAAYALTDLERRRLEDVARQEGMSLNCTLARANRFGSIHDAFPMTCVLLQFHLRGLLDELWTRRRPDNYQLAGEEAPFADLVERRIADGSIAMAYLGEVFAYEKQCWDLAMELRVRDPHALEGEGRAIRFRHEPGAIFDALSARRVPPAGLPEREHLVTVRVKGGEIVAEWDVLESPSMTPPAPASRATS
jgi:hypothetical protein